MEISKRFLTRVKSALIQAVTSEDGLDGGIAADLLAEANIALGLGERDCDDPLAPVCPECGERGVGAGFCVNCGDLP